MSSMFINRFGDTPAYTNLPLLGIVDGVVFPPPNAGSSTTKAHQVTPAASKLFARRPTWGPNWVEDPLASAEVSNKRTMRRNNFLEHKAEKQRRNQNLSPLKPTVEADKE